MSAVVEVTWPLPFFLVTLSGSAHTALAAGGILNVQTRKRLNVRYLNYMHRHSVYLICRLDTQMSFQFIFWSSAESLRDFSRLLGDLLCHCRVIALKFPSFHRDRSENNIFHRKILKQSGRFLGFRNHETGKEYLPENPSYDEVAAF